LGDERRGEKEANADQEVSTVIYSHSRSSPLAGRPPCGERSWRAAGRPGRVRSTMLLGVNLHGDKS